MSISLKERIVSAVISGLILFIVTSLAYKFQRPDRGWLVYSLCWAVPFAIGRLTPKTLVEKEKSMLDVMLHKYMICVGISAALLIITVILQQIFGVKLGLEKYNEIIVCGWLSFIFSYVGNTERKKD